MPLRLIELAGVPHKLPRAIKDLIEHAEEHISIFQESIGEQACPRFEPAEYLEVAEALLAVKHHLGPGPRFCEWGSGFGVVAAMASLLGFEAHGIERDGLLLDQAHKLSMECDIATQLHQADLFSISEEQDRAFGPYTFDLIYAYPWPDEAPDWIHYFEQTAKSGAILLTFHDFGEIRIHQKR